MPIEPLPLIKEIYRQALIQKMPPPAVTRLVKLIYLADLEWRRRNQGEPLTDLSWQFLHFGPYAGELAGLLGGPDLEVVEFETGKTARRFEFEREELERAYVPEEVSRLVGTLVRTWGDADLNSLLDHVYFETEPMEDARRGERLDFSKLSPTTHPAKPKFDAERLKALRARLRSRVEELNLRREGVRLACAGLENARAWDEDDRPVRLPAGHNIRFSGD